MKKIIAIDVGNSETTVGVGTQIIGKVIGIRQGKQLPRMSY